VQHKIQGKEKMSSHLREREDFFIKVFRPQYNIKRSLASRDMVYYKNKYLMNVQLPQRVKNLLDKCLDPNDLKYTLLEFKFVKPVDPNIKGYYWLKASTPKEMITAVSSGWSEGYIVKPEGFCTSPL
jgi:hypothetical protein